MMLQDLLNDPPAVHYYQDKYQTLTLPYEVLRYLEPRLAAGTPTLETGAGFSTVLFALKGTRHTCITPDPNEVGRIKEYCAGRGISCDNINFIVSRSDLVLPGLSGGEYDLVLIDGCHGFPTPFLDWYFTCGRLKVGGTLVIDDTHLWTGQVLRDFLRTEPEWKMAELFHNRTAVFIKEKQYLPWKEWEQQPFVVGHSASRLWQAPGAVASRFRRALGRLLRWRADPGSGPNPRHTTPGASSSATRIKK
jgi:hypothetical protein